MKIIIKKQSVFGSIEAVKYLSWGDKEVEISVSPEGKIKAKTTLCRVMALEGISKAISTKKAQEMNSAVREAAALLEG